jgi:hypothetical protein
MKIVGYPEIMKYEWEILKSVSVKIFDDELAWCIDFLIKKDNVIYKAELTNDNDSVLRITNGWKIKANLNERAKKEIRDKALKHMEEEIFMNPSLLKLYTYIPEIIKERCKSLIIASELNII